MPDANDFQEIAARTQRAGIAREIFGLIRENRKWWLAPIIVVILLLLLTAYLSSSAAAPFIYSLF